MKIIILIITTIINLQILAKDYPQISKNAPHLPEKYVQEVGKAVNKICLEMDIPCPILKAVLFVESEYLVGAVNNRTKDYGIGQINEKNIRKLKLDKYRLLTDVEYSVYEAAKILKYFQKRYSKTEYCWFARYNVGTRPSMAESRLTAKYCQKVLSAI